MINFLKNCLCDSAFAMDMMAASREVLNPVDGSPIRMRIGMHSGSVMAGVGTSQTLSWLLIFVCIGNGWRINL